MAAAAHLPPMIHRHLLGRSWSRTWLAISVSWLAIHRGTLWSCGCLAVYWGTRSLAAGGRSPLLHLPTRGSRSWMLQLAATRGSWSPWDRSRLHFASRGSTRSWIIHLTAWGRWSWMPICWNNGSLLLTRRGTVSSSTIDTWWLLFRPRLSRLRLFNISKKPVLSYLHENGML